jgi:hypothetical protein
MLDIVLGGIFALLGAIVGSLIAYYTQKRTQEKAWTRRIKREDALTMKDKVYGPIFREMNEILESMELGEGPDWETICRLKGMKSVYLFYNMRWGLKNKFHILTDKLEKYQTIYSSTQTLVLHKIRELVKKFHERDVGLTNSQVRLGLELVKDAIGLGSITLEEVIMQETKPSDFIRTKKMEWGEDILINIRVGGESKELSDFELLHENVLNEMEKEPLFQEKKKQRQTLTKELVIFLDQIRAFITVQ